MVSTEHPEWVRTLKFLLLKKNERSEYIIFAFEFAFALEKTRAKRVPQPLILTLILFYSFKKLLKAFRHPFSPHLARLSEFKKLQTPCFKLQTPCFKLQTPCFKPTNAMLYPT